MKTLTNLKLSICAASRVSPQNRLYMLRNICIWKTITKQKCYSFFWPAC